MVLLNDVKDRDNILPCEQGFNDMSAQETASADNQVTVSSSGRHDTQVGVLARR